MFTKDNDNDETMEKQLLKGQKLFRKTDLSVVDKEIIERIFINDFLGQIPLDKLKDLVGFESIDFEDKDLIIDDSNRSLIRRLRESDSVLLRCSIWILR